MKYNTFGYRKSIVYRMSRHTGKYYNQRSRRKYQNSFDLMDLLFCSNPEYRTHHTENSMYYFDDKYKGRRYQYIRGVGILETRTDKYVKIFDDPILGWCNKI